VVQQVDSQSRLSVHGDEQPQVSPPHEASVVIAVAAHDEAQLPSSWQTLLAGHETSSWPTDAQHTVPAAAQCMVPHSVWPAGQVAVIGPQVPSALHMVPAGHETSSWPTGAQHTLPVGPQCVVPQGDWPVGQLWFCARAPPAASSKEAIKKARTPLYITRGGS
jgi:hypothetical protein